MTALSCIEQLVDVSDREHIGIYDNRAAAVIHQLRRHEPERREGLQVVHQPGPLEVVALVELAFTRVQERMVVRVNNPHVERVAVGAVSLERVLRYQGPGPLPLVGVDEDARLRGPLGRRVGALGGHCILWFRHGSVVSHIRRPANR
jgi:hypothetical protein